MMRQILWHAPLPDPEAPARDLIARMTEYAPTLEAARALVRHGLPCSAALEAALERWPWSVDLGWLVHESGGGSARLATIVAAQGRRQGTLAWALWSEGRPDEALAAVEGLDPASPSYEADRLTRAELSILADRPVSLAEGPDWVRLALLHLWRTQGGAALAHRFDGTQETLPARPGLFAWIADVFVTERDFTRARRCLVLMQARFGTSHPEVVALAARLALEAGDPAAAQAALDRLDTAPPWDWPAWRLALDLRCRLALADRGGSSAAPLLERATAALRLFPRHGGLRGVLTEIRLRTEDWDRLLADLARDPAEAARVLRLGQPELALGLLRQPRVLPPDEHFRHALLTAEALLRTGDPAGAAAALPPPPAARPLAADRAWWQAEIALARRDLGAADAALAPALRHSPSRMGLHLSAARLAFFQGEPSRARQHLETFRTLKEAQTGAPMPDDLRDRLVADALDSGERAAAARAFAQARPQFHPGAGRIPRRIAHYWEGPASAPVQRGVAAWGRMFAQQVFDAASARGWLGRHAPGLVDLFDRQPLPATRADLFRVALIAAEGGIFTDLDEYPRAGIDDWLTGARAVLVIEEGHATLANNFIAAEPGLPLFTRLQTRIAEALRATATPYPWWDSGPAQLTVEALGETEIRYLTQADYDARISTNLPFPHKAGPLHWR